MSVSTSVSGYPSEIPWDSVTSNTNLQNETRFLVGDAQQYRFNPVNCNGTIYTAPKIPSVNNVNCINSPNAYFSPASYVNASAPNGLIGQETRFPKPYNGFHNTAMVPHPRNGIMISSVSTWPNTTPSGDRMVVRPAWNVSKTTSGGVKKPKRIRTAFTSQQMMELENEYARTRYLDRSRRIELSEILHLNERTIKIWFQNRRMKEKKDRAESLEDTEATSTTESSPENVPMQMVVYEPYPHNSVDRLDRVNYVEHFQPVVASSMPVQSMAASAMTGYHDGNCYPTFVLENTPPLPDQFQQSNVPIPVHCQQLKPDYTNGTDYKNATIDCKEELIENSSNHSESCTTEASKNDEDQNWDLSWIRSIHIEEELQE